VLPEKQDQAVELLSDILRPALRQEDFDTEKSVILEEIHMYEDQPPFGADEKCKAAYYGSHALGRSVLGTAQSITGLTVDTMREYFARRYGPENIALVGAGKIDFEALVAAARRYCGDWEPRNNGRTVRPATPRDGFQVIHKESAVQQYVVILGPGPSATDSDRYAARLLATVIGDDTGSRLFWELVDPGIAEHASLNPCEFAGTGLMMTYMSCEPDHVEDNLQRILNLYRAAESDGITSAELDQAKNKVSSRIVLSSERPRGRLFSVASDWIQRREHRSVRQDLDAVAAVSADEVRQVLKRYGLSRCTTVTIGPLARVNAPK
jgi:predicted Zn-dependent peptidase